MGRLAVISDLHVDINKLSKKDLDLLIELLEAQQINHLHLAGDTANTVNQLLETVAYLEKSSYSVTYNFGNHELPSLNNPVQMENYPDDRFLNLDYLELTSDLVLVGMNGWYDYSFALENDPKKILAAKNLYWYDRMIERGKSDIEITEQILSQLEILLDDLINQNKEVILATHFVPHQEFIRYFEGKYARWNQINAFLGTQKLGDMLANYPNIRQVIFGHTHRRFEETKIGNIIYTAKPLGYFYEWHLTRDFMLTNDLMTSFNPMNVRKILKHHQKEFQDYRDQHLKEEFLKSLTIVDY
ncbi:metallophosphoesterase [Vagococcus hydrophili]|uniref:Metallophosphoesterase n=1 Tax=Vagococcus hydrophili TaxID=2714947 RepID=A0A6G8AT48_9ENTE|nr:metallophosphoesterase [Vagococcus hydrophili]QIL48150.1 metallophosphoesterase [Vagococcus hydrophili]